MTITINAKYANLIQAFISTEKTRYYLNGFHVEPHQSGKGVYIVATDGHRLGCFYDSEGSCDEPTIVKLSKDTIKQCKAARKDNQTRFLIVEGSPTERNTATVVFADDAESLPNDLNPGNPDVITVQGDCLIDGTFPDWRRVIPSIDDSEPNNVAAYNAKYLGDFHAIGSTYRGNSAIVNIKHSEQHGPALVRVQGVPEFMGVVMPVRHDSDYDRLPVWFTESAEESLAA